MWVLPILYISLTNYVDINIATYVLVLNTYDLLGVYH